MTAAGRPRSSARDEPSPCTRITQRDIARAAGVDHTTVSRALRRERAIPAATQERIRTIATALGYRADPAMQALVSYRRAVNLRRKVASLAYFTAQSSRMGWRRIFAEEHIFRGARQKASEYGYRLDHLWLNEPGLTTARLVQRLVKRGVTGVILPASVGPSELLANFPWDRFTAVRLGYRPHPPPLHSIRYDVRGAVRTAMQVAHVLGYRRPALLLPRSLDEEADHDWSFTFIAQQLRLGLSSPIPVLHHDVPTADDPRSPAGPAKATSRELAARLVRFRPDVILGAHPTTRAFLARHGVAVPREVAFIDLLRPAGDSGPAGVEPNYAAVGAAAVEVMARLQLETERGIPSIATTTWVPGSWHNGASLPDHPAR